MTDNWSPVVVKAEVADVRRCLGSVIRRCEAGNVVHFETGNNFIQNVKSGTKAYMRNNGTGMSLICGYPTTSAMHAAARVSSGGEIRKADKREAKQQIRYSV